MCKNVKVCKIVLKCAKMCKGEDELMNMNINMS
jgi:hypothetical protein